MYIRFFKYIHIYIYTYIYIYIYIYILWESKTTYSIIYTTQFLKDRKESTKGISSSKLKIDVR